MVIRQAKGKCGDGVTGVHISALWPWDGIGKGQ